MLIPKSARDISGEKFNMLTAVNYSHSSNGTFWSFLCECGRSVVLKSSAVTGGHQRSCGCLSKATRFSGGGIFEGQRFNRITAVKMAGKQGHNRLWECLCDCGIIFYSIASNLLSGNTKSCGCLRRIVSSSINWQHGLSNTPIYRLWKNMMRRCYEKKNPAYKSYGGRGIYVCDRWHEVENFLADMGTRPKGRSLDRINNDGPYSPENCRWATKEVQARNTRSNRVVTVGGVAMTIVELAVTHGVPVARLYARLRLGWRDDELLMAKRNK